VIRIAVTVEAVAETLLLGSVLYEAEVTRERLIGLEASAVKQVRCDALGTPREYRDAFKLKSDYALVAPARRSDLAKFARARAQAGHDEARSQEG
jgi:predicted transcriptional regulator